MSPSCRVSSVAAGRSFLFVPRLTHLLRLLVCSLSLGLANAALPAPISFSLASAGGASWSVSAHKVSSTHATIPGCVHTDLFAAGVIGDPNAGLNEVAQRWIANTSFSYTATFAGVPPPLLAKRNIALLLRGVDTLAAVSLNGVALAQCDNQHRSWLVPVPRGALRPSGNALVVAFTAPVSGSLAAEAACAAAEGGLCSDAACVCPAPWPGPAPLPLLINAYIRKCQQDFAWDFSPATATSGLGEAPLLLGYDAALLRGAVVSTEPAGGGAWRVSVAVRVFSADPAPGASPAKLSAVMPGLVGAAGTSLVDIPPGESVARVKFTIPAQSDGGPALWWPRGYGPGDAPAALHVLELALIAGHDTEVATLSLTIGLRTIVLDQTPIPGALLPEAHRFGLTVNGVRIHARGSNWVPPQALVTRETPAEVARLFEGFAAAHFNCLRIWGGGVYASEAVLDAADAAGIVILHDFMLGDQFYNIQPAFLRGIAEEVRDQAWRMGHRASVGLYFGSNEMASGYSEGHHFQHAAPQYAALYFATIANNFSAVDATRVFMSSTPSNGNATAADPLSQDESVEVRGDMHYYALDNDCMNVSMYPRARWITEHGWESWPSFLTLAPTLTPVDYAYNSTVLVSRQHHPPGQGQMQRQVEFNWLWPKEASAPQQEWSAQRRLARYSRLSGTAAAAAELARRTLAGSELARRTSAAAAPTAGLTQTSMTGLATPLPLDALAFSTSLPSNATLFRDELWMTQVASGFCLKMAVEFWRGIADELDASPQALGGTSGILYWQADDTWPGPSWSTLELGGRAKVGHHLVAEAFAPLLVSGHVHDDGSLVVYLSLTTYAPPAGVTPGGAGVLRVRLWSWARGALAAPVSVPITLPPVHAAARVASLPLATLLPEGGCPSAAECVATLEALDAASGAVIATNSVFLTPPRAITTMVRDPGLTVSAVVLRDAAGGLHPAAPSRVFNVTLEARALPVAVVWLETPLPGLWSENAFLLSASPRVLQWTAAADAPVPDAGTLAASLAVSSLVDVAPGYSAGLVNAQ